MKNNSKKEIIERLLIALDLKKVNDLARLLNTSPQNLNGYIDRGSYIKLVRADLLKRKINIDWIKTGLGEMHESQASHVAEPHGSYAATLPTSSQSKDSELLIKTAQILESNTVYRTALKSNIEAFHTAITCHEELAVANRRIDDLEENVKQIERRLPAVKES